MDLRVHPTLIPADKQIANVNGVLNAVMISADAVGELVLVGPGAGALPTASAVMGDVTDIARALAAGHIPPAPALGLPQAELEQLDIVPRGEVETSWYLRLTVDDKPGVMADITRLLGAEDISIESLLQRSPQAGVSVAQVVIITDQSSAIRLERALVAIENLDSVQGPVAKLRVEEF